MLSSIGARGHGGNLEICIGVRSCVSRRIQKYRYLGMKTRGTSTRYLFFFTSS